VVTENGIAEVFGRTQGEQANNIIEQAAHPDAREELREQAHAFGLL
jgi:acyl-CoA hydrolase